VNKRVVSADGEEVDAAVTPGDSIGVALEGHGSRDAVQSDQDPVYDFCQRLPRGPRTKTSRRPPPQEATAGPEAQMPSRLSIVDQRTRSSDRGRGL